MKHTKLLACGLFLSMVFAGGCSLCESEVAQIASLTSQNEQLVQKNRDIQDSYSALERQNIELAKGREGYINDLNSKNNEIATLKTQLEEARNKKPERRDDRPTEEGWTSTTFGDKITVGSDVLFSSGRATLTSRGKSALSRIANALTGNYSGLPVRVYGFSDSDPIRKSKRLWADNLDLSANRAMAVTRYLISRGVPKDKIETIAMGSTHYVASNSTRAGKAKNRRVEIMVIKAD